MDCMKYLNMKITHNHFGIKLGVTIVKYIVFASQAHCEKREKSAMVEGGAMNMSLFALSLTNGL